LPTLYSETVNCKIVAATTKLAPVTHCCCCGCRLQLDEGKRIASTIREARVPV